MFTVTHSYLYGINKEGVKKFMENVCQVNAKAQHGETVC